MELHYRCAVCGNNIFETFEGWQEGDFVPVVNCYQCDNDPKMVRITDENRDQWPLIVEESDPA